MLTNDEMSALAEEIEKGMNCESFKRLLPEENRSPAHFLAGYISDFVAKLPWRESR